MKTKYKFVAGFRMSYDEVRDLRSQAWRDESSFFWILINLFERKRREEPLETGKESYKSK